MARFLFNPFTDRLDLSGAGGGGGGGVSTLTGNTGGAIPPDGSGNINVIGAGAITVSGSGNTLTITSGNPFFTWQVETLSFSAVNQNGYFCNGASQLAVTLPTVSNVGDTIEIAAMNSNGWKINLVSGQQIQFGNVATSVNGSLASQQIGDTVELVCAVANTLWYCVDFIGNITST